MKRIWIAGFCICLCLLLSLLLFAQAPLKGKWMGQTPPGKEPIIFAKGIVSTDSLEHSAAVFSPDGKRLLWGVIYRNKPGFLLESKFVNGGWTDPAPPSFASKDFDDLYPSFSVDGKTLYFNSRRPVPPGYRENGIRIWQVKMSHGDWGTPQPIDTTVSNGEDYAQSEAENGNIYFSIRRDGGKVFDIAFAKMEDGKYQKPELLPAGINSPNYEDGPYIAPDESYLIFESNRPGGIEESIDLYIAFKQRNGHWGQPINMGPRVNSKGAERFARVSPDGKYLFFGSNRSGQLFDIYWMDASVIEDLRKGQGSL